MTLRRALPLGLLGVCACEPAPSCFEDPQAQVLDVRRIIQVDGRAVEAEVADDAVERDRGWRHRTCDREALLLIPDEPGPLPIWGCALVEPIDVLFLRDDTIVQAERNVEPCDEPCTGCPLLGEGVDVDGVVELRHDPDAPLKDARI